MPTYYLYNNVLQFYFKAICSVDSISRNESRLLVLSKIWNTAIIIETSVINKTSEKMPRDNYRASAVVAAENEKITIVWQR